MSTGPGKSTIPTEPTTSDDLRPVAICNAKYPDGRARCSLVAHHDGSHCSGSHGIVWVNVEGLPLRKGTKIRCGRRDEGVIKAVDRLGTLNRSAVVLLDSGQERRVVLRRAPLRIVSPGRTRAQAATQFRLCPGCGEAVIADGT